MPARGPPQRPTGPMTESSRRHWIAGLSSTLLAWGRPTALTLGSAAVEAQGTGPASASTDARDAPSPNRPGPDVAALTVFTFGDSVLDCGRYNERGLDPGQLIVRNDDALFPEFRRRDLASRGAARLVHGAVDGATVDDLPAQARGVAPNGAAVALLTVGGNDMLRGLAADRGPGLRAFEGALERFLRALPIRPVLLGTVYDPTFGDDARNFLGVPAPVVRANLARINAVIGELALRHGRLADLHAHFLRGDPSWFTRTIEPSLVGASEIRRVFLAAI
jgi:acyl-CoA thioesterase-1